MNKCLFVLFCFLLSIPDCTAQILPEEGSSLNYRLIGFSIPSFTDKNDKEFNIEIAAGSHTTEDAFKKNIVKTLSGKGSKVIGTVPSFGSDYTWRSVMTDNNSKETYSELHHFKTNFSKEIDTAQVRLRIIDSAQKYKDAYVLLDGTNTLYDMAGRPVWFLSNESLVTNTNTRDVKVTPFGTVTYLTGEGAYESDYNGKILWKGPDDGKVSGDEKEMYHHEFNRLSNGHYMVMGNERIYGKAGIENDSNFYSLLKRKSELGANDTDFFPRMFGTVIEYNENGNVVWSWRSFDYFKKSDLNGYVPKYPQEAIGVMDAHANAFFFDEKEQAIYVSFKNISRVAKIKYPEGAVINNYGERFKSGVAQKGNGLFCNQHACKRSSIGCLFLFNNNGCNPNEPPKIKKLTEPVKGTEPLKKIWEYTCTTENGEKMSFPMGGNVLELPDQSVFACMGSGYSKVFIVNTDKKTLWSALPEKWDKEKGKWIPSSHYRASIIYDTDQLERLVWNSKKQVN